MCEVSVLGDDLFLLISVFVCMLCIRLCMASDGVVVYLLVMFVCVAFVLQSVFVCCGVSAVDVVVVPVLAGSYDPLSVLCLCIVAVPVFCEVLSVLNSQGRVCQRFYCTDLRDNLESISTLWRRDHLSAIKLLGNLFLTTLAHDVSPLKSYKSYLKSNYETYSQNLHIDPKCSGELLA